MDELFWSHVEVTGFCWIWRGARRPNGYGITKRAGKILAAHRYAWRELMNEEAAGPLDHLCRVRACVNPDHLEPVTTAENNRRAAATRYGPLAGRKTHCLRGHEYTEANTTTYLDRRGRTQRACRACRALRRTI